MSSPKRPYIARLIKLYKILYNHPVSEHALRHDEIVGRELRRLHSDISVYYDALDKRERDFSAASFLVFHFMSLKLPPATTG